MYQTPYISFVMTADDKTQEYFEMSTGILYRLIFSFHSVSKHAAFWLYHIYLGYTRWQHMFIISWDKKEWMYSMFPLKCSKDAFLHLSELAECRLSWAPLCCITNGQSNLLTLYWKLLHQHFTQTLDVVVKQHWMELEVENIIFRNCSLVFTRIELLAHC